MSIQTELTRLTNAKAAIQTAIEGKGVTVPDGTLLDGMAALIESIEAGGGGGSGIVYTSGTLVFSSNTPCNGYEITHGLGVIPQIFIVSSAYTPSEDYALLHFFILSEGLRNLGYTATYYAMSFSSNGANYRKRAAIAHDNKYNDIDKNTITISDGDASVFLSGKKYSWHAIGGIAQ